MSKPLLGLLREAISTLSGAPSRDSKLPDISESLRAAVASHRALEIATAKAVQADRREAQRLARFAHESRFDRPDIPLDELNDAALVDC